MPGLAESATSHPPPGNYRMCTDAVVYWLWLTCIGGTNDEFTLFHNTGEGGHNKRTAKFLYKMAKAKGGCIYFKKTHVFWKGAVVIWLGENERAAHAGVNGGNNLIYGYNQNGNYFNPQCQNHAEVGHNSHVAQGILCRRKSRDINTNEYDVYTVGPKDAKAYFNKYAGNMDYW